MREDVLMEAEVQDVKKYVAGLKMFEDGRGREPSKECRQPLEAEKGQRLDFPRSLPKECSSAHTLILAECDPFWTSDLWKSKIINLCCSKPLSLLLFLTAA